MKQYPLVTLIALGAAAQTSTSVALNNPGFEAPYNSVNGNGGKITGQTASGWTENSAWANATVQYAQELANPHGGESCQKIVVVSAGSGEMQLTQSFQLHAGNVYTASAWMRGVPGTIAKLRVQQGVSPYTGYLETAAALSADWQLVSVLGYITTDEPATLMIAAGSAGTIWVDDVALSYKPGTCKVACATPVSSRRSTRSELTTQYREWSRRIGTIIPRGVSRRLLTRRIAIVPTAGPPRRRSASVQSLQEAQSNSSSRSVSFLEPRTHFRCGCAGTMPRTSAWFYKTLTRLITGTPIRR